MTRSTPRLLGALSAFAFAASCSAPAVQGTCDPCGANAFCDTSVTPNACACSPGYSGNGQRCRPIACAPETFPNAVAGADGGVFGEAVAWSCVPGYSLTATSTRACEADGTWSGDAPTCAPNPCGPDLTAPANGSVSPTSGNTGDVATYACDPGYTLAGDTTRTCLDSGGWSGTAPVCNQTQTGCSPNPCAHSSGCTPVGASGFSCGTCDSGWSGAQCDVPITCAGAVAPLHGTVSAATATLGNGVTYGCDTGYTLAGAATRTCQADGTFSGTAPTCTPNACSPDLVAPSNGNVTQTAGVTGDVATFSCTQGYFLGGAATRTCQASGTWSGSTPTCVAATGCTPNPCQHSAACTPVGQSGYDCGTCDLGWSGANCDVPVTCTGATAPSNGTVSAASATLGNSVTYGCNAGYALVGAATRTCESSGAFSGTAPTCAPVDCGTPPSVVNAGAPVVSGGAGGGSSTTFGATAAYTCTSGYGLVGANPTCGATATWSAAPTCVASCGTYTDVVYRVTGTFDISNTFAGLGNQTFTGLNANDTTPAFIPDAGNSTPFSRPPPSGGTTFTNGFVRLRFTNDAAGNPGPGPVKLVEWYFPMEFTQTAGANLTVNVDHSSGLLAAGLTNCGGGDPACTAHAPVLQRPCTGSATGTYADAGVAWDSCTPVPTGTNSWSFATARTSTGPGCAAGYTSWGNVKCNSNCVLVPASGLGDAYQAWPQKVSPLAFAGTDPKTATFTMPYMQIPNGTGSSTTRLSITNSSVLYTRCGSTPGTDLVCNLQ